MLNSQQPLPVILRLGGVDKNPRTDLWNEAGGFSLADYQRHAMSAEVRFGKTQGLPRLVAKETIHLLVVISPCTQDEGESCKPEYEKFELINFKYKLDNLKQKID